MDTTPKLTKEQQLMLSTRAFIHQMKHPKDGLPLSRETAVILDAIQIATEDIIRNLIRTSAQQTEDLEAIINPEMQEEKPSKNSAP